MLFKLSFQKVKNKKIKGLNNSQRNLISILLFIFEVSLCLIQHYSFFSQYLHTIDNS